MGSTHMHLFVLLFSLTSAASVSKSLVVLVKSPVLERQGGETTLPCWLYPPQNAEPLEVRWYRNDRFDTPIILYQNKEAETTQDASYAGRASFGLKDAASGGLAAGDVSLKLLNVKLEDEGNYTCYVSSDQGYDRGSVHLNVTKTGTTPLLSMAWAEENQANVSCESEGWYPRPTLRWASHERSLTPKSLRYSKASSQLVTVHSWLLVPNSSEVSCSVGLPDEEAKEARGRLGVPPQTDKQASGQSSALVAVLVILAILSVVFGGLYMKDRVCRKKEKTGRSHLEENMKLLPEDQQKQLEEAKKHHVNITLEDKGNPYVTIKDGKFRDSIDPAQGVTCLTAIRGTPGFSAGQHYWEVSLENPNVGIKQSWWVGVTKETDFPLQADALSRPSNGSWFLSSSPDRPHSLELNTDTKVFLPVQSKPSTVGVFLNHDNGGLSFFNVGEKSVICSITTTFQGEVFPFFNPGVGDKGPMGIL